MSERILVNLFSEQRLPNFIATMQEQPDRVLALCTPPFESEVGRFGELTAIPHQIVPVRPYDLRHDLDVLRKSLASIPTDARILVNFTGGTKIMALGAVFAAMTERKGRAISLLYVETTSSRIDRFGFGPSGAFEVRDAEPIDVHIPFQAYAGILDEPVKEGFISTPTPEIDSRHAAAAAMLKPECNGFFSEQRKGFEANGHPKRSAEIAFRGVGRSSSKGCVRWSAAGGQLVTPEGKVYEVPGDAAGAFFLGGWLEEYCFLRLHRSSRFRQVLANVKIELRPETVKRLVNTGMTDKHQFDVVVCDGVRAAIVECKAGRVFPEDLHRLQSLTQYLLGSMGIPVLACRHPLPPKEREQADSLKIRVVERERLADLPSALARWMREDQAT